jgi:hypothetical protein
MASIIKDSVFNHPPSIRIFVFGSNLAGRHGKGAALHARKFYGATVGIAIGHMNHCYAIPTKDQILRPLSLAQVAHFIKGFLAYAKLKSELQFNVTQVGCGLAGFKKEQIAPLFKDATPNCWFDPEWAQILGSQHTYWSQPI